MNQIIKTPKKPQNNNQNSLPNQEDEKSLEAQEILFETLPASQYISFNQMISKYLIILIKNRIISVKLTLSKEVKSRKFIWRDGSEKKAGEERLEFEFFTSGVFKLEYSSDKSNLRSYGTYFDKGKKIELKYFSYQSHSGFFKNPEALVTDIINLETDNAGFNYKGKIVGPDYSNYYYEKKLPYLVELEMNKLLLTSKNSIFTMSARKKSYFFKSFNIKQNRLNYEVKYFEINIAFDIFGIVEIKILNNFTFDKESIFALGVYSYENNKELKLNVLEDKGISRSYSCPYTKERDEILFNSKFLLKNDYKKNYAEFEIEDKVLKSFRDIQKLGKFNDRTIIAIKFLLEKAVVKNFEEKISFEYYTKEDWDVNSSKIIFYPEGIFYKFDWMAGKDYSYEEYLAGVFFCDSKNGNIKLVGYHNDNDSDINLHDKYPEIIDVKGNLNDEEIICRVQMKKVII